jgi:hypothetical protein
MESHQPQKNQEIERLPDGQPPPPRRFRIVKLEERIAPKKSSLNSKKCVVTFETCNFESANCW